MLELLQITNDPAMARRCDALDGIRLFVDLERNGKAERQAGRNSFLSTHGLDDVGRVKAVLRRAPLMVRVNPLHEGSAAEVEAVLAQGADRLMLPMFRQAEELAAFCRLVAGRVPVTALLETAEALHTLSQWAGTPGLEEIYVGLNDLHLSLGRRFMFEPLADGLLEPVAATARAQGLRFGFGGIARVDEGLLPGQAVLGEHLRLGSQAVILSRTFHAVGADGQEAAPQAFEADIARLRAEEARLRSRNADQVEHDRVQAQQVIAQIAARIGAARAAAGAAA